MAFCGLKNGFVMFYCFECLEKGELILNSFSIIFLLDSEILKKKIVMVWYGTCVNYSSFIFVMNEGKYGRI